MLLSADTQRLSEVSADTQRPSDVSADELCRNVQGFSLNQMKELPTFNKIIIFIAIEYFMITSYMFYLIKKSTKI